ncbi:MAG TPA: hypothetical protein VL326_07190 [Kofleriaceae bacterium]|nr:hypothetical protein [Kofleriaceae bacterium]
MRRIARSIEIASLFALVAACNPGESPAIANTPNAPVSPQNPPVASAGTPAVAKGIPHSGIINEVAITEQADAAITFDMLLGIRLWPTLDGSRPPVPVAANAPHALAIAHAGRDLMAVILDDAGAVSVQRLGLDGSVRGKATLPGQYKQALATEAGVIVRTPDHAIEWYAPDGTFKGRITPAPGQEIVSIATRNGHTAALLGDTTTSIARNIRWLTLGDTLGWGMSVDVPGPIANGLFAISPNNRRVAYTTVGAVEVYELDPFMRVVKGQAVVPHSETDRGIGFIDDDRVVLGTIGQVSLWVPAKPPEPPPKVDSTAANDPWAVPTTFVSNAGGFMHMNQPADTGIMDGFAFGDSVVVSGIGTTLAISTELSTRYLGWKELASGNLTNAGDRIVMAMSGSRFVWLDSALDVKDDVELHDNPSAPWMYGVPVGDHHVVTQTSRDSKYEIALYDTHTKASSKPNLYKETERLEYTPASGLFAVGERSRVYRFKLDFETNAMVPLSPLRVKGSPINIRLFDPATANGVTAAVVGWDTDFADYQTLTIYRDKGKPTRIHPFTGQLLSEDADGTLYIYGRDGKTELQVMKDGKVTRTIPVEGTPTLTKDASRTAYLDSKNNVVVKDVATNKELWHTPMWGAQQVLFTSDAKKVVVRAIGGVATFDATTGIRTGLECGWNFGLYDDAIGSSPPGQSLVCEDPMLQ